MNVGAESQYLPANTGLRPVCSASSAARQYAFYLPAVPPYVTENSYAELSYTCAVPKAYFLKDLAQMRLAARLSNTARTELQAQLLNFFGRPFGFGTRDWAHTKGEYGCVSCFYRFGKAVKTTFEAGTNFTSCRECNETLWITIPTNK